MSFSDDDFWNDSPNQTNDNIFGLSHIEDTQNFPENNNQNYQGSSSGNTFGFDNTSYGGDHLSGGTGNFPSPTYSLDNTFGLGDAFFNGGEPILPSQNVYYLESPSSSPEYNFSLNNVSSYYGGDYSSGTGSYFESQTYNSNFGFDSTFFEARNDPRDNTTNQNERSTYVTFDDHLDPVGQAFIFAVEDTKSTANFQCMKKSKADELQAKWETEYEILKKHFP